MDDFSVALPADPSSPAGVSARFDCGPTDSGWIAVTARLDHDARVVAEVVHGDSVLAYAEHALHANEPISFGVGANALTPAAIRAGAVLLRVHAAEDNTVIAEPVVPLELPPGVECG
jgi:hypothetical protein